MRTLPITTTLQYFLILLFLLFFVVACEKTKTPSASFVPSGVDFGSQTLSLINEYRRVNGLQTLSADRRMIALARQHSIEQASAGVMSHANFNARASQFNMVCVENVGQGYRSAQHLFSGWKSSSAHNSNMLDRSIKFGGVSVVGSFSTFFACG
jgi:uncharacterized protein YkwD